MTRGELRATLRRLRDQADELGGLVDGVKLCDRIIGLFDLLCQDEDDAELSLSEAAAHSGFSEDHLRRLARLGKLAKHPRGRRLYFRAADLPKKPQRVDDIGPKSYDPAADARQVADWRLKGGVSGKQSDA